MQGLTRRQEQILAEIRKSIRERGYPPTLREIGSAMSIRSTNGVNDHLRALERKGFISRDDETARGIKLTPDASSAGDVADELHRRDEEERRAATSRAVVDAAIAWRTAGMSGDATYDLIVAVESHLGMSQGRAPAGSCPFCASRISVIERDGVFVARCSHRGCGARGPRHHDLTRACDLFCCPPQRTAGGMGGPDVGGAL